MASTLTESEFLQIALTEFARKLIRQRQDNVRATDAVASRELLDSYDFEIQKLTTNQLATAFIAFEAHGRFVDMKKISRKEQLPVDEIKSWILDKGLSAFRRKPKVNGKPLTGSRLLNSLAWGIVTKKKKSRRRRRKKLTGGTEELLDQLIDEISRGYVDRTAAEIIQSFES